MNDLKVSRIYAFPSGAEIDLKRVIMIGGLDKDISNGDFYVNVFTEKRDKPIQFRLGWAIGKVPEDEKAKILKILGDFKTEWRNYKTQDNGND